MSRIGKDIIKSLKQVIEDEKYPHWIATSLRKIRGWWYSAAEGIENTIAWLPVIWNDRDFDHHFLYAILHKKLERMEKFHRSEYAWAADHNKTADKIRIAKNLAKRLMEDKYLDNATYFHDKKYEWFNPFEHSIPSKDHPGLYEMLPDPDKARDKDFGRCCKHSNYMEKQDQDMLFKYINKHIRSWWD